MTGFGRGQRCEHVFRELYESASYAECSFLQLKVWNC